LSTASADYDEQRYENNPGKRVAHNSSEHFGWSGLYLKKAGREKCGDRTGR
jgi:hypothetical protein